MAESGLEPPQSSPNFSAIVLYYVGSMKVDQKLLLLSATACLFL